MHTESNAYDPWHNIADTEIVFFRSYAFNLNMRLIVSPKSA